MRSVVCACIAVLSMGCGPVVMIPGGALSGSATAVPDDWSFSDAVETVQLETRPDDPYSVNIWGVAVGSRFYVAAGQATNTWAQHIAQDDRVRLRIGDAIYELRAVLTSDDGERESFLAAAKTKYEFEPDEEQLSQARLFRLEPR